MLPRTPVVVTPDNREAALVTLCSLGQNARWALCLPGVQRGQVLVSPPNEPARWNSKVCNHKRVSIVLEQHVFKGFGVRYGCTMLPLWISRSHMGNTGGAGIGVFAVSMGLILRAPQTGRKSEHHQVLRVARLGSSARWFLP